MSYDSHISIMLSSLYDALEGGRGWSLVRVGDGEQRVLAAEQPPWTNAEGGGMNDAGSLDMLRRLSIAAIRNADWVGWFANHDTDIAPLEALGIRPAPERSQCAWVNQHMAARRTFVEKVLRASSLFLVGNPMQAWLDTALRPLRLGENAKVYQGDCEPRIWMECRDILQAINRSPAQVVIVSLGIWALPVCDFAMSIGKVAIDYGHAPDEMMPGHVRYHLPNTCCEDSPEGTMAHYAHANWPPGGILPEKGY